MKIVVCVGMAAAIFAVIGYGSMYILGGIEAGMPGGGHGKFADYHQDNKVTSFLEGNSFFGDGDRPSYDHSRGDISSNPYAK